MDLIQLLTGIFLVGTLMSMVCAIDVVRMQFPRKNNLKYLIILAASILIIILFAAMEEIK